MRSAKHLRALAAPTPYPKPKPRTPGEYARIYGSRERVRWIKHLPCVFCIALSPFFGLTDGSSHNAHTETGGTGFKAGFETIVPLCHSHHVRFDEYLFPFDNPEQREAVRACAAKIQSAWLAHLAAGCQITNRGERANG